MVTPTGILACIQNTSYNLQKIIEYDNIEGELYKKLAAYLELIESSIKRTIIFASDDYEIASVYKYLMQKATVDLKLMTGSMSSDELNLMVKEWNQYRGYVNMPILCEWTFFDLYSVILSCMDRFNDTLCRFDNEHK